MSSLEQRRQLVERINGVIDAENDEVARVQADHDRITAREHADYVKRRDALIAQIEQVDRQAAKQDDYCRAELRVAQEQVRRRFAAERISIDPERADYEKRQEQLRSDLVELADEEQAEMRELHDEYRAAYKEAEQSADPHEVAKQVNRSYEDALFRLSGRYVHRRSRLLHR